MQNMKQHMGGMIKMSVASCEKCGDSIDTDFQMAMSEDGKSFLCDKCWESLGVKE